MKNYFVRQNDLFDNAFDGFFRSFYPATTRDMMRTDVHENDNEYLLDIEMPGFKKGEISVSFDKGYLSVSAKREESEEDKTFIRRERNYSCDRRFYVGEIDESKIKAKYEDGVLKLSLAKQKEQLPPHTIAIE